MFEINQISKTYKRGAGLYPALSDVSLKINEGNYVSVTGPSGSGKSTLLNIIGGLIRPDSGEVIYKGENLYNQNSRYLDNYRRREVGFMFQQFHLMPYLTVTENIRLSLARNSRETEIFNYLKKCALAGVKDKYPSDLSVGEKQRTAFIRAIISGPELLLADEPTGNLDPRNSEILMLLIKEYHKEGGTVVLVSHHPVASGYSDLNIKIENGKVVMPA